LRWTLEDDDLHAAMERFSATLSSADGGHALSLANALWGQSGEEFLDGFLALNRRHYGAAFREVDFSSAPEDARLAINDWAERNTNDRIKELLVPGDVTPTTALVLTNAIHFKGTWKYRFDVDETRKASFRNADGRDVAAEMMWNRGGTFRFLAGDGFKALALPYAGDRASMVVLLPDPQSDLARLEQRLTAENIEHWLSEMRPTEMGTVMFPRFELTSRLELAETLREMGMPLAFSSQADFSGITTARPLSIDDVIHKAFVQVNEEGTEAAAATAVKMKRGPALDSFRADRPFIYLIQDHATGAILFMGRLADLSG
jgi:serpin B